MADPFFNDVMLLSPFNEADGTTSGWVDYSSNANTWTKSNSGGTQPTIETSDAVQLFGANALYLAKTSSQKQEFISIESTDFALTTSDDLTVEYWYYYVSSSNATAAPLVCSLKFYNGSDGLEETIDGVQYGNTASHQFAINSVFFPSIFSTYSVTGSAWHHIAISVDASANEVGMYIDGARQTTTTWSMGANRPKAKIFICSDSSGATSTEWQCYVADLRITKAARYSGASFDVPTARFETQAGGGNSQKLRAWHYVPGPRPWFN